jgi:hypothetical protein
MEPAPEPEPVPKKTLEETLKEREELFKLSMKFKRNILLNETDKYLLPDYPITPDNLEIVKDYRKSLRNFTQNNYILPEKPDFVITLN